MYFFDDIDRIYRAKANDLKPIDILRQTRPTTGLIEQFITTSEYEKVKFQIVDTGGQVNERRKWIHQYENMSAVVYVASLSAFDERAPV